MARHPTSSALLPFLLHHHHHHKFPTCTPNSPHPIRVFTTIPNPNQTPPESQIQTFQDAVEEASKIVQGKPRRLSTILTLIPSPYRSDANFLSEVLRRQTNVRCSLRFFNFMSYQPDFTPDEVSCKLMFDALVGAKAKGAKASLVARCFIEKFNLVLDSERLRLLIRCLCRDGWVDLGVDLFSKCGDHGICPGISIWNTVLLGAVRGGRIDVFWRLYEEMIGSGVETNAETVDCLISVFCADDKVERGYELLRNVLSDGVKPRNFVFDRLIAGFCGRGDYGRVSEVLHLMIAMGCKPSCYNYQEIINSLCKKGKVRDGYRVFKDLRVRGHDPNIVMYTTMIHGLFDVRLVGEAKKLWSEMIEKGLRPNEYAYNAMIHGLCKAGDLERAQELHKEMGEIGYKDTTVSYNTLIAGMCQNMKTEEACKLFDEMSIKGISRDLITYNSLIRGLCKEGNVERGDEFFLKLLEEGLKPSRSSYTFLIRDYCMAGRMDRALELWKDMNNRGVEPSGFNIECIIHGLCMQGSAVEGMHWLSVMLKGNLIPQYKTFETLLLCLLKKDELDDALLILDSMLHVGYLLTKHVSELLVSKVCVDSFQHVKTSLEKIFEKTGL